MQQILIADRRVQFCEKMKQVLEQEGYEAATVTDREMALRAIARMKFDLLVVGDDLASDPQEIAAFLRRVPPTMAVLMLEGDSAKGYEHAFRSAGADQVLVSPFTYRDFLNAAESLMKEEHISAVMPPLPNEPEKKQPAVLGADGKPVRKARTVPPEVPGNAAKKKAPAVLGADGKAVNSSLSTPEYQIPEETAEEPFRGQEDTDSVTIPTIVAPKTEAEKIHPIPLPETEKPAEKTQVIHTVREAEQQPPVHERTEKKEEAKPKKKVRKVEQTPEQKKKAKKKKIRTRVILTIVLAMILLVVGGGFYIRYNLRGVPELDLSKFGNYSKASTIYDSEGNYFMDYGSNENVDWVTADAIPQTMKDAIVSIEDKRFYQHHGVDIKRTLGAIWGQITHTASYGGSTITQQLIKNTFLTQEVTYKRKIQEIYLALQLEKRMSKEEILEWYLNTVYMGGSNYGIKNAAEDYFGKDLDELTLREYACLAGIVQSPNNYNPRTGDMDLCNARTDTVLYAMLDNGKITQEQYDAAIADTLVISEEGRTTQTSDTYYANAYFVDYAMKEIATKLLEASGKEVTDDSIAEMKQDFRNGGYSFYLTIDPDIQSEVQTAAAEYQNYPTAADGSEAQFSAVVIEQSTGEVKAIVGGREQADTAEGYNRATDSTQAVGSSIKPLSVYAPAIETGDYPGTVVDDMPYSIPGYGTNNGWPSGDYTDGPITMRRALELSHNIPAARFMLEHVGIDKAYDFMVSEGFDANNLTKTAAGLALGATDVTTLEMAGAYATLANGGVYIQPHCYTKVLNRAGEEILNDGAIETHRVFSESTAWLTTDMMQTNMTEGLGVNARLSSVTSCGKTGTHEHQVISFGGYTHYYTSFMRISTDNYTSFTNSSSYYQAAPLWKAYMDPIHQNKNLPDAAIQNKTADELGIIQVRVCNQTGLLAGQSCEDYGYAITEYATPDSAPTETCEGHEVDASQYGYVDPETGAWVDGGWWDESGNFHPFE